MKKWRRILVFIILLSLLVPATAVASQFKSGDETINVPDNEVVNDDLYTISGTSNIYGTINGDLFVLGGTVNVSGTVKGDIWIAGGTLNLTGSAGDDVRVAGGTITLNGPVASDVLIAGGNVTIGRPSTIGQDLWIAGGSLTLDGKVGRNARISSGDVTIGGTIGGDVKANVGTLKLAPGSLIGGNLKYSAQQELSKEPGSRVVGITDFTEKKEERKSYFSHLWGQFYWFLAALILMLAIMLYGRRAAVMTANLIVTRPLACLLVGFIFLIVAPILMVILLITLVGIPISVILLVSYLIILYTSKIFVSLAIGQALIRRKEDRFWLTFGIGVIGLAIYYLLTSIPAIGIFVALFALIFGTGAQLLLIKQIYQDNRQKYGS